MASTIQSAELEGNDVRVYVTDGTTTETLTWGRNVGESDTQLKARVKAALVEVMAVRNPAKASKTNIPLSAIT